MNDICRNCGHKIINYGHGWQHVTEDLHSDKGLVRYHPGQNYKTLVKCPCRKARK
jgi:hypothetical protein